MNRTKKSLIAGASVLAIAAGATGVALGTGQIGESDDAAEQVSGPDADRAAAAALEITKGGTVNAVERDSAHGATWEVEITKPDGNTVDVYLDENLKLVTTEGGGEELNDSESE